MQKLYELKTDEAGNEYIEWEYAGDTYMVVMFANRYKFLKRFKDGEKFSEFASLPRTDGKDEIDWDTAFYYGTILMESTAVERMLQLQGYFRSLSHTPAFAAVNKVEGKREPIMPREMKRRATVEIIVGCVLLLVFGVLMGFCYLG